MFFFRDSGVWGKYTGGAENRRWTLFHPTKSLYVEQNVEMKQKYKKKNVHGMKFRISTNKNIKHAEKMCVILLLHHVKKSPENGI